MHHIRPHKLFALINERPSQRVVNVTIPYRRGAGGLTLLEMFVAIAASRIVGAKRLFEFGTFLGSTTLNLALNLPDDGEMFTLDLDEDHAQEIKQDTADAPLTQLHLASKSTLDFVGSAVAGRIKTLTGNSRTFDFSRWKGLVDLVFIDGGHDIMTVRSDTENALKMVPESKLSCVLWHDYGNPAYQDLTRYLDELSERLDVVHVEDTMLCVWFNDPAKGILPLLLRQ